MDTKLDINSGDFYRDPRCLPLKIEGMEELLQRIAIALTVPMGSFPYNRSFGGDRTLVERSSDGRNSGLMAMAENALSSEAFHRERVKVLSAVFTEEGKARIDIDSALGKGRVEVII